MRKTALLFFSIVLVASTLLAQRKVPAQSNLSSIEIEGVKLHFGMTKADVAERFVGTQTTKTNEDSWFVGKYGMLRFRNGKLVFASRSWNNVGDDSIDAIFGVISSLNREGYTSCKVLAENKFVPVTDPQTGRVLAAASSNLERVWIVCGAKSVLIVKAKVGDHLNEDVSEQLGVLELDSE